MKTIIYYRKSTDRDDKQANSLEHQLANCLKVAEKYNLEVIKQIGESKSAKTEFTRPWFNELIDLCKSWKVDFIVIDEPKRLSRNNIDTSRIIDLLDKKLIKGILWSSREYRADNSRDKFLLQLDLSLSKMDNEDRSKDVKDKMESCINNTKRFLWKAPFGYKNVTIKKGHKEIHIDKKQSRIVKEIFDLRIENKAFTTIANIIRERHGESIWMSIRSSRIQDIVNKKFYYWTFTWNWKEIQGSHTPIISKQTYDKAKAVWKWVYQNKITIAKVPRKARPYHLKGFAKDIDGILLCAYVQKWHTYYMSQPRSSYRVNLNENKIFHKFEEILKNLQYENEDFYNIQKDMVLDLLKKDEETNKEESVDYKKEIEKLEKKQEDLVDMKLDWKVSEEIYLRKNNQYTDEINRIKEQILQPKSEDFELKTQKLFELLKSHYTSYKTADNETKAKYIKKYLFELFIDHKKDLQIEESPLLKGLKYLHSRYGTPGRDRTHANPGPRPGALPLSYGRLVCSSIVLKNWNNQI